MTSKSPTTVIPFRYLINLKPQNLPYSTPSHSHLALVLFPLLIWEFICISEHFNYMQWFYTWIGSREPPSWKLFFSTLAKMNLVKITICRCDFFLYLQFWVFFSSKSKYRGFLLYANFITAIFQNFSKYLANAISSLI